MKKSTKHLIIGILIGIISPLILSYITFSFKYNQETLEFLNASLALYTPMLQLGALANLAWFFLFNHFNLYFAQRGIIVATFIIFGVTIYLKYFA